MFSLIATVAIIRGVTKRVIMPLQTPQVRKKPPSPIGYLTGQNTPVSNFFCQQNLTKPLVLLDNKVNFNFPNMAFGKLGSGLGSALAIGAAVAAMPDKAEAGEFANYCAPIANGEILDTELTPQNMGYIFDKNGNTIPARLDELIDYYGNGITEECDTDDIGAYVNQYGNRVLLEIYPPGQYPLGIDPTTMQQIEASYGACIAEELAFVDKNKNGVIDDGESANLYKTGEVFCNEELQGAVRHAGVIAAGEQRLKEGDQRIAALKDRQAAAYAQIEARTAAIIQGARKQIGLN